MAMREGRLKPMTELHFHAACILMLALGGFANMYANYLLERRIRRLETRRKVMFWEADR
jgi:hypothetical protein